MDSWHKRFYLRSWARHWDGSIRAESEQRVLNEGLAACYGVLMWVAVIGLFLLLLLQRFEVQWAQQAWLAQVVFAVVLVLPLAYAPTRRLLWRPLVLKPEEYGRYMRVQRKITWRGLLICPLLGMVIFPDLWQDGWAKGLVQIGVFTAISVAINYWMAGRIARRALARYEANADRQA